MRESEDPLHSIHSKYYITQIIWTNNRLGYVKQISLNLGQWSEQSRADPLAGLGLRDWANAIIMQFLKDADGGPPVTCLSSYSSLLSLSLSYILSLSFAYCIICKWRAFRGIGNYWLAVMGLRGLQVNCCKSLFVQLLKDPSPRTPLSTAIADPKATKLAAGLTSRQRLSHFLCGLIIFIFLFSIYGLT